MKNFWFTLLVTYFVIVNHSFGADKGMPQLNSEFWASQIFWLTLIFVTLYVIIWKIFLPKITNSLENRKSRVVNDINEAQKLKETAEKKLSEYNKIIENAKKEAKKIIEDNRKNLENEIKNKKQKINDEMEKELIAVEKEILNLKKSSIENINKISVEISSEVIRQIIGMEVNKSNVSAIVEDILKKRNEIYQ
tara:strand:- start:228 stop:806 length:579 start_codon:yes stop_codon:yes gene_type:complete